jgi:hypothetical protein
MSGLGVERTSDFDGGRSVDDPEANVKPMDRDRQDRVQPRAAILSQRYRSARVGGMPEGPRTRLEVSV